MSTDYVVHIHLYIYILSCPLFFVGAVVAMNVWKLDIQLHMQSVSITTDVVGSTPAQGEVYNIM